MPDPVRRVNRWRSTMRRDQTLTPAAQRYLADLASHPRWGHARTALTVVWPREDVAKFYGVHVTTVQRWNRQAIAAGWLLVEQRGQKRGQKGCPQVYRLIHPGDRSPVSEVSTGSQGCTDASPVLVVTSSATPSATEEPPAEQALVLVGASTANDLSISSSRLNHGAKRSGLGYTTGADAYGHQALALARSVSRRCARRDAHLAKFQTPKNPRSAGTALDVTGRRKRTTRPVAIGATYSSARADERDPEALGDALLAMLGGPEAFAEMCHDPFAAIARRIAERPEWLRDGAGDGADDRPEWLRDGPPARTSTIGDLFGRMGA